MEAPLQRGRPIRVQAGAGVCSAWPPPPWGAGGSHEARLSRALRQAQRAEPCSRVCHQRTLPRSAAPWHGEPVSPSGDGVGRASISTRSGGTGAGLRVHVTLMGKPQAGRAPHPHVLCPRPPRAGPPAVSVAGSAFRGQDARPLSTGPRCACTFSEENAGQPVAKRLLGQVTSWQRLSESPCCALGARHGRDAKTFYFTGWFTSFFLI